MGEPNFAKWNPLGKANVNETLKYGESMNLDQLLKNHWVVKSVIIIIIYYIVTSLISRVKASIYFHPSIGGIEIKSLKNMYGGSDSKTSGKINLDYFWNQTEDLYLDHNQNNNSTKNIDKNHKIHMWNHRSVVGSVASNNNKNRKLIIYSHGNAGNLLNRVDFFIKLSKQIKDAKSAIDWVAYDYSGFGNSHGEISEEQAYKDGTLVINEFIKNGYEKKNIILWGESIGCPISLHLGDKFNIHNLIVQSGPSSMTDMAEALFGYCASRCLSPIIGNDLSSEYYLNNIINSSSGLPRPNILFMHSEDDEIVPYSQAVKLSKICGWSSELHRVSGGHNGTIIGDDIWTKIERFILK